MLPNHTGASEFVTNTYIDCDIDANDDNDEDTNNNDLLEERQQCLSAKNVGISHDERPGQRSVRNGVLTKMTIPQVNETFIAQRPSSISLKPIVNGIFVDKDETDGCFGDASESEHECAKGINVKFQDIIYRARRGFSWDRCEYKILHFDVQLHRILDIDGRSVSQFFFFNFIF